MANKNESCEKEPKRITISTESQNADPFARTFILKFIDEHIREIKWVLYGIGTLGGLLVLRNVHATKQFEKLSDIPVRFIEKNVTLQGKLVYSSNSNTSSRIPILWTLHEPLFNIPFRKWAGGAKPRDLLGNKCLPIGLAGVESCPATLSWLNENVKDKHIWFQLLEHQEDFMAAIVKYRKGIFKITVNKHLVRHGIGKMCDMKQLPGNIPYNNVIDELIKLESLADKKGIGLWREESPSIPVFKIMFRHLYQKMKLPFKLFKSRQK